MRNSLAMKCLAAVALGIMLLAHLSPVAAGVLLCIGDGTGPDCCPERYDSLESLLEESTQLLDGSNCVCCITVDAVSPPAGASFHKASIDVARESTPLRNVALPTRTLITGTPAGDVGENSLSSIRTVVLLI
jgi:hypothetical protein